MGDWLDAIPVAGEVEDAAGTVVTGAIDIPADGLNVALNGEDALDDNTGWYGDSWNTGTRQFDGEPGQGFMDHAWGGFLDWGFERPDEAADTYFGGYGRSTDDDQAGDSIDAPGPTVSEGANQVIDWTVDVGDDLVSGLFEKIWSTTAGKAIVILTAIYVVGQLVDVDAGGAAG